MIIYILAMACFAMSFPTAILRHKGHEKLRYTSKLAAALLFCATAVVAMAQRSEPMSFAATWMLVGLFLGLIGDIVLGLDRFVPPKGRGNLLLIGGVPFFFGHIAYIVALLSLGYVNPWLLFLIPLALVIIWVLARVLSLKKYLTPFMLYSLVLAGLMITTLSIAIAQRGTALGRIMILPGIVFTFSDISLLFDRFYRNKKTGERNPAFFYMVAIPYFSAQALFALSVQYL